MAAAEISRGAQLLEVWRGERMQKEACEMLGLDTATYSRLENGVRKPTTETGIAIEEKTVGAVPIRSWYEPPTAALTKQIEKLRAAREAA